jgi:hypothetical protein
MGQLVDYVGELKLKCRRRETKDESPNIVYVGKPETKWSKLEQVETVVVTHCEGPNPCMLQNTGMIWA